MNERFLQGQGIEHSGQIKIGVVRIEDLLGGQKSTFGLCELLDTCDEDITGPLRAPLIGYEEI